MYKWYMYTHILTLVLLVFMKSCTFCMKPALSMKSTEKQKKTLFNTDLLFDLVFCRVQREGQLDISYILVVFGGVCGACMCKWYMYTHILTWFWLFSWKVVLFVWKVVHFSWKALKSTWKTTKTVDSIQISDFDLVFHRVQREGQLGISYILVVFGGSCGACMCKWYMYTHILTWFCLFSWKVALFVWKVVFFMKSTWKGLKSTWKTKNPLFNTDLWFWPGLS